MKIKSLKEGPIEVHINFCDDEYYWKVSTFCFGADIQQEWNCKTKKGAKDNWKRLAKRNGWKNWKFI